MAHLGTLSFHVNVRGLPVSTKITMMRKGREERGKEQSRKRTRGRRKRKRREEDGKEEEEGGEGEEEEESTCAQWECMRTSLERWLSG